MQIAFLAPANSVHSHRWIKFFAEREHDIHWISLHPPCQAPPDHVNFYEIKPSRIPGCRLLSVIRETKRLIHRIEPEVLHVHSLALYGFAGAMSGFHPLVATAWGSDVLAATAMSVRRPFLKYVLKKADMLTCDADHMKEAMIRLGVAEKKIEIVYFGIDTDRFSPREEKCQFSALQGIPGRPIIISLRTFHPIYDVESLIRAVPTILKEVEDAVIVLVGAGPLEKELKECAQHLNVSERIVFVGTVNNDELPHYLNSSDVYVSTALSDAGLSASTGEAMACGVPVVVTDSGENRKWVRDGMDGFVVPVKSPEAIAEGVVCLLKDADLRKRLGGNGHSVIMKRNNYRVEMAKMENLCVALVDGNS